MEVENDPILKETQDGAVKFECSVPKENLRLSLVSATMAHGLCILKSPQKSQNTYQHKD